VPRIALASCSRWPTGSGDHAGLAEALAARGADVDWVPWDDATANWSAYDLVVLRETWDYPPKLAAFLAWVDFVATVTSVANGPAVVRWNHHKGYLLDLAASGVPVVPTTVVQPDTTDPAAALSAVTADVVVVKPAVGIGGDDAVRGGVDDPSVATRLRRLLAAGDVLVQPYLRSIESSGETSVILVAGRVVSAVAKRPAAGEFRIHEHRGGTYAPVEPSRAQAEVAVAACEVARRATGEDLLYARADLVADGAGRPLVMELELIEPSLYLHVAPAATADLADAVMTATRPTRG
jgi:glutathione synthase/RimK-type ligase-like ATP-grasp enzyme